MFFFFFFNPLNFSKNSKLSGILTCPPSALWWLWKPIASSMVSTTNLPLTGSANKTGLEHLHNLCPWHLSLLDLSGDFLKDSTENTIFIWSILELTQYKKPFTLVCLLTTTKGNYVTLQLSDVVDNGWVKQKATQKVKKKKICWMKCL